MRCARGGGTQEHTGRLSRPRVGNITQRHAGLGTLREGQKISYEIVADRRSGKSSADNLRAAG